jgi:alkyl sulfatase BDS1-like metallo-beta-lactamase superfamily hydrolase
VLHSGGESLLARYAETAFPLTVTEVVPGAVFHVVGLGHSNATVFIGNESVILVDALDSDARGARLRAMIAEWTDKPVKTIIYTHGHPDHRGGAGAFADTVEEVIAFAPVIPPLGRTEAIAGVQARRGSRQFGYGLTDAETITQGLGIREGIAVGDGVRAPLAPTTLYAETVVERTIDGTRLTLHAAPGETEDQIFVWADDLRVMCCGDNYYGCWPNLYAIRGGQYRDVATWIDSLDRIRAYPAVALLPGHTLPILGEDAVQDVLGTYRDAIDHVLTTTLACIDCGMTIEETVDAVTLPERFADKPYLGEYYGTVAWSVRSIYTGYLGWFDGNPTNLNPLPHRERAAHLVGLAGGRLVVRTAIRVALDDGQWQWAAELADLLLALDPDVREIRVLKARALLALARHETSANGRHYYLAAAKELVPRESQD